jgi:predicted  nucleic acid-binding Zn-ribbon protein
MSSFILLLAIISAVCSFFLFEKRELLLKGWGKMADTIQTISKTLDTDSGTSVAGTVTGDALNHEHYDNLGGALAKPVDQAKRIVTQRNELADLVAKSGRAASMTNAPAKETLSNIETYAQAGDSVVRYITDIKRRYDDTVSMLAKTGDKVQIKLDANNLKGTNYKTEYAKFDNRISAMNTRIASANNGYTRLAQLAGAPLGKSDLDDDKLSATTENIYKAVNKIKADLAAANNTIRTRNQSISSLEKTVEARNKEIADGNTQINKLDEEIRTLRQVLMAGGVQLDVPLWKNGSKEARRALLGRVIEIDNHYGFIVLDVGTRTTVVQQLGSKQSEVNPELGNETEFIVVRDLDKESSKYIGRIKLFKISEHNAYARLLNGNSDKEKVRAGDYVFLPTDMVEVVTSPVQETAAKQ